VTSEQGRRGSGGAAGGQSGRILASLEAPTLRARRVTRGIGAAALFLLTSLAFAALCPRSGPSYPESSILASKLEHLARVREGLDLLFIGSSRVYRGVDPVLFDRLAAERGHELRSFNLGVPNLGGLELAYLLEDLLGPPTDRPRWVVVDPGGLQVRVEIENLESARVVNWHDARHTALVLELLWGSDRSPSKKVRYGWRHLFAAGRRYARLGEGVEELESRLGAREAHAPVASPLLGPAADGFRSLEDFPPDDPAWPGLVERRRDFEAELEEYWEAVRKQAARHREEIEPLSDFERGYLRRLCAGIEAAGATPIFIVSPRHDGRALYLQRAAEEGVIPVLFDYSDPERQPELYSEEMRYDGGHLNASGAQHFTRLLAADLLDHIDRAGERAPR